MEPSIHSGTRDYIWRLMREEFGLRKAARIMLFLDRERVVEMLMDLPDPIVVALSREMAILKAQIQDMERELEAVRQDLENAQEVTQVIDLSPPRVYGAGPFAFLDRFSGASLRLLHHEMDDEALACVVCNAPIEAACELVAGARSRFERQRLVEAMTKVRKRDEGGEELALKTRKFLGDAYQAARMRHGLKKTEALRLEFREMSRSLAGSQKQESKHKPKFRGGARSFGVADPVAGASRRVSLEALLSLAHPQELQGILGSLSRYHLALAISDGNEVLRGLLLANLSDRAREDIVAELASLKVPDSGEVLGARRAIIRKLLNGLRTLPDQLSSDHEPLEASEQSPRNRDDAM